MTAPGTPNSFSIRAKTLRHVARCWPRRSCRRLPFTMRSEKVRKSWEKTPWARSFLTIAGSKRTPLSPAAIAARRCPTAAASSEIAQPGFELAPSGMTGARAGAPATRNAAANTAAAWRFARRTCICHPACHPSTISTVADGKSRRECGGCGCRHRKASLSTLADLAWQLASKSSKTSNTCTAKARASQDERAWQFCRWNGPRISRCTRSGRPWGRERCRRTPGSFAPDRAHSSWSVA